jgi:hypothetical protein
MLDSRKLLAERIADHLKASTGRCIAAGKSVTQTTEFIATSRETIARSRVILARDSGFSLRSVPMVKKA